MYDASKHLKGCLRERVRQSALFNQPNKQTNRMVNSRSMVWFLINLLHDPRYSPQALLPQALTGLLYPPLSALTMMKVWSNLRRIVRFCWLRPELKSQLCSKQPLAALNTVVGEIHLIKEYRHFCQKLKILYAWYMNYMRQYVNDVWLIYEWYVDWYETAMWLIYDPTW